MPQDPSQMAGMAPAFMNQPQYQQQMQQLAMQVRQQEDGIKKTKKFLKAYEDIQLSQPMPQPQQQPAFMQPPGGMAQAMNNNLPQVEEAPMSFTQMAGGMAGGEDAGAVGDAGVEGDVGPEGQPAASPRIGSPEDPGLSQMGNKDAGDWVEQSLRNSRNYFEKYDAKGKAQLKAYEEYDQATKDAGVKDGEVGQLKRRIQLLEMDIKKGPGTHIETDPRTGKTYPISGIPEKDMPMMKKQLEKMKEGLKKIETAFEKVKNIRRSIPNKALGLGATIGGSLMATANAMASSGDPEIDIGRWILAEGVGRKRKLSEEEAAAVRKVLELEYEGELPGQGRLPRSPGLEPIDYTTSERMLMNK